MGCWPLTRDCAVPSLCLPLHPPSALTEGPLSASLLETVPGRVGGHEPHLSMQKTSPSSQSGPRCGQGPRWINDENHSDVPSLGQTASSVLSDTFFSLAASGLCWGSRELSLWHKDSVFGAQAQMWSMGLVAASPTPGTWELSSPTRD